MYRELTFRVDFPELSDDECYVVMRNPILEERTKGPVIPRHEDGSIDETALEEKAVAKVGERIIDWVMWDRETGAQLALPSDDPSVMDRCPVYVLRKLNEACFDRLNPTRAEEAPQPMSSEKPKRQRLNPTPTLS